MAKIKTFHYVCGVIHVQDRVLLIRPLAYNGRPYTPFFFPGTQVGKNEKYEQAILINAIKSKYKGEVTIDSFMGTSVREYKDKRIILKAYYCSVSKNFFLPRAKVDYRWAKVEDFENLRLEQSDQDIAERYLNFKHVYDGELVPGGRPPKEAAELNFYLDSFEYFSRQMDIKDAQDFNELMRTSASIQQLRQAYKYVMRINHLDYNVYLAHYEKKNPPKKKDLYKPTTDEIDIPDQKTLSEKVAPLDFVKGQPLAKKGEKHEPPSSKHPNRLRGSQITGIVLLSVALIGEIVTLLIALIPLVPNFYSTLTGTLALVFSSLLLLVGVMLAIYGRKED
ncbi:MAG: hypothetical protein EOM77_01980 [Bacteroidia bacterium]|nr:hypothetical protein [Bacteroidia bacterium]